MHNFNLALFLFGLFSGLWLGVVSLIAAFTAWYDKHHE